MKTFIVALIASFLFFLLACIIKADAGKGGGKPGTLDWGCYYACTEMGGDRLECLSRCMK